MRIWLTSTFLIAMGLGIAGAAQKPDFLNEDEVDELREAQGASERIQEYMKFAQVRVERFDDFRNRRPDPEYDIPGYLNTQLDQYIRITDALKDWIEDHFDRRDDMRAGLKKVLELGPHQLEVLRHAEESPDSYFNAYHKSLDDAIEDFSDALDGATKALSEQTKMLGELKREEKADAQTVKARAKDEQKVSQQEEKLRKKEHEKGPPMDPDED